VHKYHQFLEQAKHEFKCDKKVTNYELFKTFLKNQLEKERKTVAIEQTPRNSFHFEKISSHIPESKIIHIYRDPRAVLVSQKNKWKRNRLGGNMTKREMMRTYFNHNPFVTSTIYNKTLTRIIDKSKSLGNKIFYQIKYEKLLVNSSDQIRHLFQFLGLEFDSEFLNINHNSSSFVKIEKKGIDKSRIDSWQLNINSAELFICHNINKKLIAKLEYPFIRKIPSPLRLISYLVILPFQIVLILLFNFRK
jgi:hypothetical protein